MAFIREHLCSAHAVPALPYRFDLPWMGGFAMKCQQIAVVVSLEFLVAVLTRCPGCFDVTQEHHERKYSQATRGGTYGNLCGSYL